MKRVRQSRKKKQDELKQRSQGPTRRAPPGSSGQPSVTKELGVCGRMRRSGWTGRLELDCRAPWAFC